MAENSANILTKFLNVFKKKKKRNTMSLVDFSEDATNSPPP